MNDSILIKKIQKGEKELFTPLVEKYYDKIYLFFCRKTGNSIDSYDLTQEVFLRLARNINTYVDHGKFQGYIFTIAHNLCNDYYKSKPIVTYELMDKDIIDPKDFALTFEEKGYVAYLLNHLSKEQMDVAILYYEQGLKLREIADVIGVPLPTVKSRFRRMKNKLHKIINERGVGNER